MSDITKAVEQWNQGLKSALTPHHITFEIVYNCKQKDEVEFSTPYAIDILETSRCDRESRNEAINTMMILIERHCAATYHMLASAMRDEGQSGADIKKQLQRIETAMHQVIHLSGQQVQQDQSNIILQ